MVSTTTCECGCGATPRAGRRFLHGHSFRGRKRPCQNKRGPESPAWRGGRGVSHGYVTIYVADDDPLSCMRTARNGHVNGDRTDNRLENLQLRIGAHGAGQVHVCLDCGSSRVAPVEIG